jgi:glycerol-3-phosphate dehydrogenase
MNPSVRATIWDLSSHRHDLLVIGGGATGAGIAREAALRGLKVALVDRYDFGWGTSSRSSRLIHGGLRYLEHRQWTMVRESLAERAILLRTAPHLVRRLDFLFPLFRGDRLGRWKLELGLTAYDLLAIGGNVRRHRSLGKRAVLEQEPLIREKDLHGGALYWDAQCDDARLTLGAIRSAAKHGALVANYVCVTAFDFEAGQIRGAIAEDQLTGGQGTIRARVVVNATGPWVDRLRALENPRSKPILRPTRGSHVMVPRSRIGHHHAITFLSPIDGRVMFILPWGDRSYIGTTDTDTADSPDQVTATESDILYLLRSANAIFPGSRLSTEDVSISWAGLRPLIGSQSAGRPSDQSREHAILTGLSGLITVAGGKLTTFRRMAVEVVDHAKAILDGRGYRPTDPRKSRTAADLLPGGEAQRVEDLFTRGMARGLSEPTIAHLVGQYGSETPTLFAAVDEMPEAKEPIHPHHGAIGAQVIHAVRQEYARRLDDVLFRRLSLAHETPDGGLQATDRVAQLMGRELGWDEGRRRQEVERYRELVTGIPRGRTLSSSRPSGGGDHG